MVQEAVQADLKNFKKFLAHFVKTYTFKSQNKVEAKDNSASTNKLSQHDNPNFNIEQIIADYSTNYDRTKSITYINNDVSEQDLKMIDEFFKDLSNKADLMQPILKEKQININNSKPKITSKTTKTPTRTP